MMNGRTDFHNMIASLLSGESSQSSQNRLTMWKAAFLVVGELACAGILTLPKAIENAGGIAIAVIVLSGLANAWCGLLLCKCWMILKERFPDKYSGHCRDPCPSIAFEAFGRIGKVLVSAGVDVNLFGASVVFVILSAQNMSQVFAGIPGLRLPPCIWMMIVAVVLIPLVWLGSPKDFWQVAVGATVATALSSILLIAATLSHPVSYDIADVPHDPVDFEGFSLAFGTILFTYGGSIILPTIQLDMAAPADFTKSVVLSYGALLMMFVPSASIAYFYFGNQLDDNVLATIGRIGGHSWMFYATQALLGVQILFSTVIILNPVCQEFEKFLSVPLHFTWKRAVTRGAIVLAVLFTGLSVPHFGPMLSFIGGSVNILLCIILPCLAYLKLVAVHNDNWPPREASLHEKLFIAEAILVGSVGGIAATWSSIKTLSSSQVFSVPCYTTSLLGDGSASTAQNKLTLWTAALFAVGDVAGVGILALPKAVENTGQVAFASLVLSCLATGWCGLLLSKCWLILMERFPEKYSDSCRDPYPSIAYEAFGKPGRILASVCIDVMTIGNTVTFIILCGDNLNQLFSSVPALKLTPCIWMIISTAFITPFTWLGTPKDFWMVAASASLTAVLTCALIMAATLLHPVSYDMAEVQHDPVTFKSFALAFGIIIFTYSGAYLFPAVQHDMRVPSDFNKSVILAFTLLLIIYLPYSAVTYFYLGNQLDDNALVTISRVGGHTWMFYCAQVLVCTHLLSVIVIYLNPVCQEFEHLLNIPLHFTWKRAALRTGVTSFILFISLSIPHFGPIMSLVGGTTATLLCIIFPCLVYLKLRSSRYEETPSQTASLKTKILSAVIVAVSIMGGVAASWSAITALTESAIFIPPCYVNITDTIS